MQNLQALFVDAVRRHQSGFLDDAERLYRRLLQSDPRHADSLHMLGVLATQRQDFAAARALIQQAIDLNPAMAPYHANLATCLRNKGETAAAAESYQAALRLKPDYAEAHNNLGATLRDLGDLEAAEASIRRALHYKPNFADAHNNLGNLLRETGRAADAQASYRLALQYTPLGHPKMAQYQRNLGVVLRELGRREEAESLYRRALSLTPLDPELHDNLGLLLSDLGFSRESDASYQRELVLAPGRVEGLCGRAVVQRAQAHLAHAERLSRRALAIQPDFAEAHHCLGTILLDLGQIEAAALEIEQALHLAPANAIYHFNLGATKKYRPDDPQITLLEALLPDIGDLPEDDQLHLHFALAKAYDDIGEKDRGFQHLLAGNALKRRSVAYDEAQALGFLQRIETIFTDEMVRRRPTPAAPTGPIFILGMPRSGSTLIEQILASHPQVFGGGEVNRFSQAMAQVFDRDPYPEAVPRLTAGDLDRLAQLYQAALRTDAPSDKRVTDKLLRNFLYCGLIAAAMPDARIIHTRRDPVDTCLSCYSKLFVGAQPFSYDLGELGRYYRGYEKLMAHWRRVLPPAILIDVDYEAVVADLEGETRKILAHCGLPWDDACLAFHQTERAVRTASATQVRQPIYQSSVGRWRPDAALLKPLMDGLAGVRH